MTSSIPAEQSSFVSPLRRLTSRKKQGLRKLKPMRKDTPKLSGGGWLNVEQPANSAYPEHKQAYVPQAYPGETTGEQPQVVLFDSQRPQLQGGGVDTFGMAPVPQQAAGNPPAGSTHDSYMPEAYPSNAGRPGQAPVVLFDENREQLKGGGFFGACCGCLAALICCDILT
ncbi:hypothetical protein GGH96_000307 [Coemansia sp. RSA 1972]|nr:hypothetical protein GGH96_000307 [Coemansia sp. RSA 1972]